MFENLPEVGDPEKPKLVFFFDEAHLLFTDIAPAVEQKIEQLVRLIRSKGVGVYFVSQNPLDIPDVVLGQLGNRVQHALRGVHSARPKSRESCCGNFSAESEVQSRHVITELAAGEALVSMLEENRSPQIVERAKIVPPRSQIAAITPDQRRQIISAFVLADHYEKAIDRESAFEKLKDRARQKVEAAGAPAAAPGASVPEGAKPSFFDTVVSVFQPTIGPRGGVHDSVATSMAKRAMRAASSQMGRQVVRGILGEFSEATGAAKRRPRATSLKIENYSFFCAFAAPFSALPAFTSISVAVIV